jgi:hypothetical protein
MRTSAKIIRFGMAAFFILLIALPGNSQEKGPTPLFTAASKIGIMPYLKGKYDISMDEPLDKILTCTIEELCFVTEDIKMGAEKNLTNYTQTALTKRLGDQILPKDLVGEIVSKIATSASSPTPKSISMETGKLVGADFVIVGAVWRYKNRTTASGVPGKPASVAFAVYLLEVSSGKTIWKNKFIKSQTGLTDDFSNAPMFLKGGMKWLTADELAKYGVNLAFKKFPFPEE